MSSPESVMVEDTLSAYKKALQIQAELLKESEEKNRLLYGRYEKLKQKIDELNEKVDEKLTEFENHKNKLKELIDRIEMIESKIKKS